MSYPGVGLIGITAMALSSALVGCWPDWVETRVAGAIGVLSTSEPKTQGKQVLKRPPLIPPKRLVAVQFVDIKLTKASTPTGFGVDVGLGNSSGSGSQSAESITISNPADFAQGVADVMITSLTESKGFLVVEQAPPPTAGAQPAEGGKAPELVLRAVITDMTCRKRSGGLAIGDLSGGQGQFENKVTMDVRLVDPVTGIVIDSVKATGRKTSKSSIFSVTKWSAGSYLNPATKVLDLTFADFEDTPLAEATRLATQDAVRKLIEKSQGRPWEAAVLKIVPEDTGPEFYLNVGAECGLKVGDHLELLRLGELLTDEKSGKVLGRSRPKPVGLLTVSITSEEFVICRPSTTLAGQGIDPTQSYIVRDARQTPSRSAMQGSSPAGHDNSQLCLHSLRRTTQ